MPEVRIVIDHLKLDYKGPFEFNQLLRLINSFTKEQGYDIKYDKDFEINSKTGKQIDYQVYPWKKFTDYSRYNIKIQIKVKDMVKVEAVRDKKKVKIDSGHLYLIIDAFLDTDYFGRWDNIPLFLFLRSLYDKFIYKVYTERFEQRLVYDVHLLNERIEQFLGVYRNYKVITESAGALH